MLLLMPAIRALLRPDGYYHLFLHADYPLVVLILKITEHSTSSLSRALISADICC